MTLPKEEAHLRTSQKTLIVFVEVVALHYAVLIMECHNSHKHSQSPLTSCRSTCIFNACVFKALALYYLCRRSHSIKNLSKLPTYVCKPETQTAKTDRLKCDGETCVEQHAICYCVQSLYASYMHTVLQCACKMCDTHQQVSSCISDLLSSVEPHKLLMAMYNCRVVTLYHQKIWLIKIYFTRSSQ